MGRMNVYAEDTCGVLYILRIFGYLPWKFLGKDPKDYDAAYVPFGLGRLEIFYCIISAAIQLLLLATLLYESHSGSSFVLLKKVKTRSSFF
jgi:hypothetical protein